MPRVIQVLDGSELTSCSHAEEKTLNIYHEFGDFLAFGTVQFLNTLFNRHCFSGDNFLLSI